MNTLFGKGEEFKQTLLTKEIGHTIYFFDTIASTNDLAWEKIAIGTPNGTVIVSLQQTKGKGRHGRVWFSPIGGLWFSVIVYPKSLPATYAGQIPLVAGVAIASAIREQESLPITLKWPNDLMLSNKKAGGILAEIRNPLAIQDLYHDHDINTAQGKKQDKDALQNKKSAKEKDKNIKAVVLGIGINANLTQEQLSNNLETPATSLLIESGRDINMASLLPNILLYMENWLIRFEKEGFAPACKAWKELTQMLGKSVTVTTGKENITGIATDMDETGALILKLPSNQLRTIIAGDVTLLSHVP